jgi:hypothetical protein
MKRKVGSEVEIQLKNEGKAFKKKKDMKNYCVDAGYFFANL